MCNTSPKRAKVFSKIRTSKVHHIRISIYLCSNAGIIKRLFLSLIYLRRVFKTDNFFKLIQSNDLDIKIFPVEESDIEAIYKFDIQSATLVAAKSAFFNMVDKKHLFEHALKNYIPCPQTLDEDELESNSLKGSVVVKPKRGMGSENVKFFFLYYLKNLYNLFQLVSKL